MVNREFFFGHLLVCCRWPANTASWFLLREKFVNLCVPNPHILLLAVATYAVMWDNVSFGMNFGWFSFLEIL